MLVLESVRERFPISNPQRTLSTFNVAVNVVAKLSGHTQLSTGALMVVLLLILILRFMSEMLVLPLICWLFKRQILVGENG